MSTETGQQPDTQEWTNTNGLQSKWDEAGRDTPTEVSEVPADKLETMWDRVGSSTEEGEGEDDETPEDLAAEAEVEGETTSETVEGEPSEDQEPEEVRFYSAKLTSGETLEIPDDATFKVKVNGRFRTVTFKDLKNHHAGQVAWDSKYQELAKERQKIRTEIENHERGLRLLNHHVAKMTEAAQGGDIETTIRLLGDMMGRDPREIMDTYLEGFEKFYSEMSDMTEEQRELYLLKKRQQYKEEQDQKKSDEDKKQEEALALARELEEYQQKYDILDSELTEAFEALVESKGGEASQVTVPEIVSLALDSRILSNVDTAAQEVGVKLDDENRWYAFSVIKASEDRGGTPLELADYVEIIRASFGDDENVVEGKAGETLSRKVAQSGKTSTTPKRNQQKPVTVSGADSLESLWDRLS